MYFICMNIEYLHIVHFFITAAIKISGGVNIDGDTTWVNSAEYTTTTSTYVNTVVVKGDEYLIT